MTRGLTLDSGALIAFERAQRDVVALLARAVERRSGIAVPAGVVAQVWRDGSRQVRLSRLLAAPLVVVVPLDDHAARAVGQLVGVSGTSEVVDASVAWCARQRGDVVVTSDPKDILAVNGALHVHPC